MSSVLVQEIDMAEKHVYFVSKVFRGTEACYQKIEELALVVFVAAINLEHTFRVTKTR